MFVKSLSADWNKFRIKHCLRHNITNMNINKVFVFKFVFQRDPKIFGRNLTYMMDLCLLSKVIPFCKICKHQAIHKIILKINDINCFLTIYFLRRVSAYCTASWENCFIQFLREYVCLYFPYTLPWDSASQDSQQKSPSFLIIKVTRHWAISKSQQMWMRTELFIQMSPPPMCPIAFLFNYKKYWAISNILIYW